MRVVSAYLLAVLGGNASPSASDIEKICKAFVRARYLAAHLEQAPNVRLLYIGGVDVESDRVEKFLSEVSGKDLNELLTAGREKLASLPAGGGGGGATVAVASGGGAGEAQAVEEKKEEEEESEEDMGFSLFD